MSESPEVQQPEYVMRKPWFWERNGRPSRSALRALASGLRAAADGFEKRGEVERAAELRSQAEGVEETK